MTEPLVSAEVDLRDFEYMPLKCARLRKSKEWLLAKKDPQLGFYAINLWAAAWHEVPAASLEDDDDVLADLAMCPLARWKKVREKVLRKWVKCSDGRLYHPIVAEVALDSWAIKQANRKKTDAATAARKAQRDAERESNVTKNDTSNVTLPPRSPREVKRSEENLKNLASVVTPTDNARAEPEAEVKKGSVGNTEEKSTAKNGKHGPSQWWANMAGINATADTLGMHRLTNETDEAWTDRVKATVDAKMVQDRARASRGLPA